MNELLKQIADLLEEESVDVEKKFSDYEGWDSFTRLSVLALLDSTYHTSMTYQDLEDFKSIGDFCKEVMSRQ
jgi:acyl carrier protein